MFKVVFETPEIIFREVRTEYNLDLDLLAKFSGYSCRVCTHSFRESEGRYHCVECEGVYLCKECIKKGGKDEVSGHDWRHEFEVLIGE